MKLKKIVGVFLVTIPFTAIAVLAFATGGMNAMLTVLACYLFAAAAVALAVGACLLID